MIQISIREGTWCYKKKKKLDNNNFSRSGSQFSAIFDFHCSTYFVTFFWISQCTLHMAPTTSLQSKLFNEMFIKAWNNFFSYSLKNSNETSWDKKLYNFSKLQLLDDNIDRKTNFAKLSFKNWRFAKWLSFLSQFL